MSQPDKDPHAPLAAALAQIGTEFLTLQELIESGELVTEADREDAKRALAEPEDESEEAAGRAARIARIVTEATNQAASRKGAA